MRASCPDFSNLRAWRPQRQFPKQSARAENKGAESMYFKQITVPGLGCFSYVIGCPAAKAMAVVDPKRDVQDYLDIARDEGMKITHIIDTHIHADHLSGSQELRSYTRANIWIQENSPVAYEHQKLKEGSVIEIGNAKLEVLDTPGHTPHSISLLVTDKSRSGEPWMILTGDLLFVGDIGRPDLAGEEVLGEQVQNLYHSLYVKLAAFPDHLEVFPAHGMGSLCGRGMSSKTSSTLGFERRNNPMLQFKSFEDFRAEMSRGFPARPKSFSHIIRTNARERPCWNDARWTWPCRPNSSSSAWNRGPWSSIPAIPPLSAAFISPDRSTSALKNSSPTGWGW
jgi:hydroxyacylglutathione hydrolase